MLKLRYQKEVRNKRASFFILILLYLVVVLAAAPTQALTAAALVKLEKSRELVLKGDRSGAIKILKDGAHEPQILVPPLKTKSKSTTDVPREWTQAWQEIAEVFLTDKGQNQFSLAESIWISKPKEALDILTPLLKVEDGNLQVCRLGARSALRMVDCARAESFVQQAEFIFPAGNDVHLLKLQVQDCSNGLNSQAPALKLQPENEPADFAGAVRLLEVRDAFRRKDFKGARSALVAWEASKSQAADNPEYWYWKWKISLGAAPDMTRDRAAARKYLGLCSEMTPRRRRSLAMFPELCSATETVESNLKSSDKAGT